MLKKLETPITSQIMTIPVYRVNTELPSDKDTWYEAIYKLMTEADNGIGVYTPENTILVNIELTACETYNNEGRRPLLITSNADTVNNKGQICAIDTKIYLGLASKLQSIAQLIGCPLYSVVINTITSNDPDLNTHGVDWKGSRETKKVTTWKDTYHKDRLDRDGVCYGRDYPGLKVLFYVRTSNLIPRTVNGDIGDTIDTLIGVLSFVEDSMRYIGIETKLLVIDDSICKD